MVSPPSYVGHVVSFNQADSLQQKVTPSAFGSSPPHMIPFLNML